MGWVTSLFKGFLNHSEWEDGDKYQDFNWPAISSFGKDLRKRGYDLRWVSQKSLGSSQVEGWEICFIQDNRKKIKYRILNSSEQVLIKKRMR